MNARLRKTNSKLISICNNNHILQFWVRELRAENRSLRWCICINTQ